MDANAKVVRGEPLREQQCATLDEGFNWHRIRRLSRKG